jgi:hypothetical protein
MNLRQKICCMMLAGAAFGLLPVIETQAASHAGDMFDLFVNEQRAPVKTGVENTPWRRKPASVFDLLTAKHSAPEVPRIKPSAKATARSVANLQPLPRSEPAEASRVTGSPVPKAKPLKQQPAGLAAASPARERISPAPVKSLDVASLPQPQPKVTSRTPPAAQFASKPAPDPVKPSPRFSCDQAKAIIAKYAFSSVEAKSCETSVYGFAASRGGKQFLIKISGLNGELVEVRRDPGRGGEGSMRDAEAATPNSRRSDAPTP